MGGHTFPGRYQGSRRKLPSFRGTRPILQSKCLGSGDSAFTAPSVESVNYPALVPTRHLNERYRRRNGGYGYIPSIIFHDVQAAVTFYDTLDVCKGTSIGANFTLAFPYAQLVHFRELGLAEANGVPPHIVRISVGVEIRTSCWME